MWCNRHPVDRTIKLLGGKVMIDRRVGNQRVKAGQMGHIRSSAGGRGIDRAVVDDASKSVMKACHSFAGAVDWQQRIHIVSCHGDRRIEEQGMSYTLSENHEGLHSGRYITVSILPAAGALDIGVGYYDSYGQPNIVCKESLPLREATIQKLERTLMEMYDGLDRCGRAEAVYS